MIDIILITILYLMIGIVITLIYEILTKNTCTRIFGRRFHHSMFGIVFILLGILAYEFINPIYLICIGIGIIIQHTIVEKKLVFID